MSAQPDDIGSDLLLISLGVAKQKLPQSKKSNELNKVLRGSPFTIPELIFGRDILFHRVSRPLTVGTDTSRFDVETKEEDGLEYVVPHGHGDPRRPSGVSLFVPLSGANTFQYAHEKMFARFGNSCFTSTDPRVLGTYAAIDELAMRTDCLFGAHVTLSTSGNVLLKTLNEVAEPTGNNWSVCCKANAEPLELPRITDYYGNLVLLLLDLVVQYSSDASDCFMAAYYAYELANAFCDGLFVEPDDEEELDILEQALVFGCDHVILRLVIEARNFLDKVEVTINSYFAIESIISLAKEKFS